MGSNVIRHVLLLCLMLAITACATSGDTIVDAVVEVDADAPAVGETFALVAEAIPIGGYPIDISLSHGAVWVVNHGGRSVARIEPETRQVTATIALDHNPQRIAVGEDAIWVTFWGGGGMEVVRYPDGSSSYHQLGSVARIDLETEAVTGTVTLGRGSDAIGLGEGAVWIVNSDEASLARVHPATLEVVATIDLGDPEMTRPVGLGEGFESIWVLNVSNRFPGQSSLLRIDPTTNRATMTIEIERDQIPLEIAISRNAVWITAWIWKPGQWTSEMSVMRVDPQANAVDATLRLPDVGSISGWDDALWVSQCMAGTVVRIDLEAAEVTGDAILVGSPAPEGVDPFEAHFSCPGRLAVDDAALWVLLGDQQAVRPVIFDPEWQQGATPAVIEPGQRRGRLTIELRDGEIIVDTPVISGGDRGIPMTIINSGSEPHQVTIASTRLSPDALPVRGNQVTFDMGLGMIYGQGAEEPSLMPGETREDIFAPSGGPGTGTFVVFCNEPGHYQQGEHATFRVE
jgi:DNA-binding beta-propeller fold protein YncE